MNDSLEASGGGFREAVQRFFNELERLSSVYEELTDTDVRESLHLTLNYYFVWAKQIERLPCSFGMFTQDGDRAVAEAVRKFLLDAEQSIAVASTPPGPLRLSLLQDRSLRTTNGGQYDLYIGHVDEPIEPAIPEIMFGSRDYEEA